MVILTKDKTFFPNFGSFAVYFHKKLVTSKNEKIIFNQKNYINLKLELLLKSNVVSIFEYRDYHIYVIDKTIYELLQKMIILLERAF